LRTNKGLKFDGEPIDEEAILYLKASLEKSIRLAKEITKDKFIK
jgi:Trm5-related predicted tRNA methylase